MTLFIQHGSKEINFSKKQQLNQQLQDQQQHSECIFRQPLDVCVPLLCRQSQRLLFGGTKQAEKRKRELYYFQIFQRVPSIQVLIRVQQDGLEHQTNSNMKMLFVMCMENIRTLINAWSEASNKISLHIFLPIALCMYISTFIKLSQFQ